ncbi:tyrosine-type recombinase/integrase [Novosphingobium album (ex Hu et al. 2023)]|uniref:Tyrosine-type recombinase/integrase n=1 Tax=Novosphingobium album (ex Hu et al. 2023) TaxID=2930093 RepID=A0ABT0AX71_9SPHN|nr:site-specific integrase [Novosphingobium album (ex Hu et al. 2023)]MCJ2177365.1 tyrosine-type recombinase/integrase [Novosphingobium album (ex Hu et al. 2023)]
MGKLTQAHIKAAIGKPGRHHDGDGLVLFVRESGQASWVARIQHNGTRREIGLGSLRAVGLGEAREKASTVKAALVAGRDPHLALKPPKEMTRTFREAALGFLEAKTADAKISDAKRKQNLSQLKTYAFPALGKLQVQSIDADTIAACLRPIWTRKPETARKVRSLIIRTLRFARPDGALFIGTLGPAVADRLPAQPKRGNFEAMPYAELPAFMSRLADKGGMGALALRAAILTAARSGEVRGATWGELDLEAAVWTVPAERMKARRPHRVPLSPAAVALLREAASIKRAGTDLIFPASSGKALSDMTLTKVLRDMDAPFTVHGFRSTFRDWAAEQTSLPGEVAEAALAHTVPKAVEAAYRRTDFFDKRRELMDSWSRFVSGGDAAAVLTFTPRATR